ncbi:hypothetical protein CMV_008665 [Castanea mollissima]|uniref:Uncharacterized protein n=1 Tax=Castanea mollissima TaxID=60419 RepID=A0A8J4VRV8_9ROSI|nr:hypothetical protein CMV_008665 [Castanea mollissima]
MGHSQIYNVKVSGVTAMPIERFRQIDFVASSCLQTGLVECEVSGADCSMYGSGHKGEPSLRWVHDKSFENLAGTNATTDSMDLQYQNCHGGKRLGDFVLSGFGSSKSVVVNTKAKCTKLIGMTFCKKPPITNWTDMAFENASFTLTISNPAEDNFDDNFDGSSGTVMDDISPFFEGNCREAKEVVYNHARVSGSDFDQFVMGIPTHCQNDGSYLYLLTPVLSPPSTNSVYRWLSCDDKGSSRGSNVESVKPSPLKGSLNCS